MTTGTQLTDDTVLPVPAEPGASPSAGAPVAWWRDPSAWAMLVALLVWAVPFTHAGGGRDPFALTYSLLALVPALVLVRPWRVLGRLDLLALAPAAAALLACFLAPTGFDGLAGTASYAYAGVLFMLVRGYLGGERATSRATRLGVVVGALLIAGADQFLAAWWAWYGSGDSASLMVGTFYWHNQFAVFMAAIGLLGAVLAARGNGGLRWAGGTVAVLAVPALAFAASRATVALAVLAFVALAVVSLRRPRALLTFVALPLVGLAFTAFLASPLFMTSSSSVATNIEQRESVVGNGSARLTFDRVALELVADHPLTGTGANSFGSASAPLLPTSISQPTAFVHNGFLQAYVDGGVFLGTALTVAVLLPIGIGLRIAWRRRLGRRGDTLDPVTLGALVAAGLLAVHSAVDFDWTYPSLLALFALVAALLCREERTHDVHPDEANTDEVHTDDGTDSRGRRPAIGTVLAVAVVAALVVAVPASARASATSASQITVPTWAKVVSAGVPLTGGPAWMQGASACTSRLRAALGTTSTTGFEDDLACTEEIGEIAPSVQIVRAKALTRMGRVEEGQTMADDLVARYGARIPQLVVVRATLPADRGDRPAALTALRAALRDPRVAASPPATEFANGLLESLGAQR